ncbi:helical backbone metal receptor [Aliikangiella sp. G2MR2-5]|uniref:helical backbone metal receptor n=1 Tax=Aliikangiella sp. G2MR2-5 TaxID=2788943 RepID=UPI0018A894C5|nr:helical backbone metal receptor [Aliikangiella sp. G2MR2-5]
MKIICLVPSITETLIASGVELIGRSRFCIHPKPAVESIPKVGGTKDVDWDKVSLLKPDLVIFDKEENTLEMANSCPFDYIALHIQSIHDVAKELARLANKINNSNLTSIAHRWEEIATAEFFKSKINEIPGVIEWWKKPEKQSQLIYLIWKDPWMAAGEKIFIQSMLDHLGYKNQRVRFDHKYPQISLQDYPPEKTLLLFSSEPFPFERYRSELLSLGYSCALVDGEKYSWYGIRSLEFLEKQRSLSRLHI